MKIHYAKNFLDAYRIRAGLADINEMSGRTGSPAATRFINDRIAMLVGLCAGDSLADVGCGDGTLVALALDRGLARRAVIGVLPTDEEVQRVRARLVSLYDVDDVIQKGLSNRTNILDEFATKTVCNSVLQALPDHEMILLTLRELARITRKGGLVFVGEVPDVAASKVVSTSDKPPSFVKRALRFLWRNVSSHFDHRVQIVTPPSEIEILPDEFERLAASCGLRTVSRSPSLTVSVNGQQQENPHRWDFLFDRAQ